MGGIAIAQIHIPFVSTIILEIKESVLDSVALSLGIRGEFCH